MLDNLLIIAIGAIRDTNASDALEHDKKTENGFIQFIKLSSLDADCIIYA